MRMSVVRSIVPGNHPLPDATVGGLYVILSAIGVARCWRCARVMTLFIACYLGIVLVWPFSPQR